MLDDKFLQSNAKLKVAVAFLKYNINNSKEQRLLQLGDGGTKRFLCYRILPLFPTANEKISYFVKP